jgi:hypothetical protein
MNGKGNNVGHDAGFDGGQPAPPLAHWWDLVNQTATARG